MKTLIELTDLAPSADHRAKIETTRAVVAQAEGLHTALGNLDADIKSAEEAVTASASARANALVEGAKTGSAMSEAARRKMHAAHTDAVLQREALGAARATVLTEIEPVEAEVQRLVEYALDAVPALHAARLVEIARVAVEAAIREHVLPLVLDLVALQSATGSSDVAEFLGQLNVPGFGFRAPQMLSGTEANLQGERFNLSHLWRNDPARVEAHRIASEPRDVLAELRAYRTLAQRTAVVVPYVRKGYTHHGIDKPDTADARTAAPAPRAISSQPVMDLNRAAALRGRSNSGEPVSEFAPRAPSGVFGT